MSDLYSTSGGGGGLHVDVHVLPGLPEKRWLEVGGGYRVGLMALMQFTSLSPRLNTTCPAERDDYQPLRWLLLKVMTRYLQFGLVEYFMVFCRQSLKNHTSASVFFFRFRVLVLQIRYTANNWFLLISVQFENVLVD